MAGEEEATRTFCSRDQIKHCMVVVVERTRRGREGEDAGFADLCRMAMGGMRAEPVVA
jgi:hypothetical protein